MSEMNRERVELMQWDLIEQQANSALETADWVEVAVRWKLKATILERLLLESSSQPQPQQRQSSQTVNAQDSSTTTDSGQQHRLLVAEEEAASLRQQLAEKQQQLEFLIESNRLLLLQPRSNSCSPSSPSAPLPPPEEEEEEEEEVLSANYPRSQTTAQMDSGFFADMDYPQPLTPPSDSVTKQHQHQQYSRDFVEIEKQLAEKFRLMRRQTIQQLPAVKQSTQQQIPLLLRQQHDRRATIAVRRQTRRLDNLEVMNKMTGALSEVAAIEKQLSDSARAMELASERQMAMEQSLASQQDCLVRTERFLRQLAVGTRKIIQKNDENRRIFEEFLLQNHLPQTGGLLSCASFQSIDQLLRVIRDDIWRHLASLFGPVVTNSSSISSDSSGGSSDLGQQSAFISTLATLESDTSPPSPTKPSKSSSQPQTNAAIANLLQEIRENRKDRLRKVDPVDNNKNYRSKNSLSVVTGSVRNIQQTLKSAIEKHRQAMLNDDDDYDDDYESGRDEEDDEFNDKFENNPANWSDEECSEF